MKIMYVTSECAPFIKTGGLGDVAGSLPQALAAKGHDVRVFCPLYSAIDQSMREKFYYIKNAYVRLGWRNQYCGKISGTNPERLGLDWWREQKR